MKYLEGEEKKTSDSVDKAQMSRAGSRGKEAMPNIRVVSSQPKTSPTLDIVIDMEETVNPLSNSRDSRNRGSSKPT